MSAALEVDPPRYMESVPTATAPVVLPDLRSGRGTLLAGVITGGALLVFTVAEILLGLVVMA
jgi:UDP-N-acetylglucosamine enolpyruvyl transferase